MATQDSTPGAVPSDQLGADHPGADIPEADLVDLLRIHLATLYDAGAGVRLWRAFGSASTLFRQSRARLAQVPGVSRGSLAKLHDPEVERRAREELRVTRQEGIQVLAWGASSYPAPLGQLAEMPLVLFCRGDLSGIPLVLRNSPPAVATVPLRVGIIGTRRPSVYGQKQAQCFARVVAQRGIDVVSGLARGIDGDAHRAALDSGGRTIAVLGSGMGRLYPSEHAGLARQIWESGRGAVTTEFPFGAAPRSFHFPMRNRVLSGLSLALIVVEAGENSGTLITVRHALDQGKSIYAVPGRVDRPEARGCLRLLSDGAGVAMDPAELVEEVLLEYGIAGHGGMRALAPQVAGYPSTKPEHPSSLEPAGIGFELLRVLGRDDRYHADQLAEIVGGEPSAVLAKLCDLESAGKVKRLPGGFYALSS
jgi:DNA processing protein